MRQLSRLTVAALLGGATFACTRERIIIVRDPTGTIAAPGNTESGIATSNSGRTDGAWGILNREQSVEYAEVIRRVESMVTDSDVSARVRRRGLGLVNVTWEDTGRAQGSALGPNISDLTLQVRRRDDRGGYQSALMPVIRFPNFADRTGDIPADKFFVRVGNERGDSLRSVPLSDVLRDIRSYVTVPSSIVGAGNLSAVRDTHYLASAQAVFMPIPKQGRAEFNPVVFNYQSAPSSPAVLTLLVTREGTSISVIENRPEESSSALGYGQEIYYNDRGQKSAFTAERRSDVAQRIEAQGGPKTERDRSALERGADVLFVVQVPLRHRYRGRLGGLDDMPAEESVSTKSMAAGGSVSASADKKAPSAPTSMTRRSDVENAVIGHGPSLGPVNEGRGLRLERDPSFPIRITVQFYKATSNGVVSDDDLDSIARSIGSVYEHADYVGSLVLPQGDPRRPTAWQSMPTNWFSW